MRELIQIAVLSAAFGLLLLFTGSAAAAENTDLSVQWSGDICTTKTSINLDSLEGLSHNPSTIGTITNSYLRTARIPMQEFTQLQRNGLPIPPLEENPGFYGHRTGFIEYEDPDHQIALSPNPYNISPSA